MRYEHNTRDKMTIGYVYIISSSTGNYVGSTTKSVEERFNQHKKDFNIKQITSRLVLEGENLKIETLEEVEYIEDDDDLLKQEEQKWIDMTDCVNVVRSYTPDDWKRILKLEGKEKYRLTHKEQIKEKMKERYEANKEYRLEKQKKYYNENREKVLEYHRERYDAFKSQVID
jgi:predicted GIY-YIG superfamily endonuclease